MVEAEQQWEKMGPTPKPSIKDLRSWDFRLLERYKPFYSPTCDLCCFCTFGKCDLTRKKKGACGIDIRSQQARQVLLFTNMGASAHAAHARHLVDHVIEKFGGDFPIQTGNQVQVEAPLMRLIMGVRPKTMGDLKQAVEYIEEQITHLLSATNVGQEGSHLDFESKALHAGMMDNLALEVADIAQISAYGFPKGDPEAPLIELGAGVVDASKPVTLTIGHNVLPSIGIVDYLRKKDIMNTIEVAGLCCSGHDLVRHTDRAKIIGPMSDQLKFIRSGLADVVIVDEQCVRTNVLPEAQAVKAPVIASSDKICYGLPDMSDAPAESIAQGLVSGKYPGVVIYDPEKLGQVAVQTSLLVAPIRNKYKSIPSLEEFKNFTNKCTNCGRCRRNCPIDLPINDAIFATRGGDLSKLEALHGLCLGCVRCESECPLGIPVMGLIEKAAERMVKLEKFKMRAGRGYIQDTEIREVGAPIVLGKIPGVIAIAGCSNYPKGGIEIARMAEEYLKRRFIVTSSGCAAMDIARYKNEEGKTLYESYPGTFEASGLTNVGSCVANAHIAGAAIKIASIFAKRSLRGNYEEIADYILNRVGAVAIVWGAMSQKALSIGTGINRLGIPVILGPQGTKYRRLYLGNRENADANTVYDARTGNRTYVGPVPEHLAYAAESIEEATVLGVKLCIRANDTSFGRQVKLAHYCELHKKYMGRLPDDVHMFVRAKTDIPLTLKGEISAILEEKKWSPTPIPDPTLLERMIRTRK